MALALALVVLVLVADGVAGRDIRLWWILADLESEPANTVNELRLLGQTYKAALSRAVFRGGRRFDAQLDLTLVALQEPYYMRAAIREALGDGNPVVRRAAAVALLRHEQPRGRRAVPEEIGGTIEVLREWMAHADDAWLDQGLNELSRYEDPRFADMLTRLLLTRSEEGAESLIDVGRANENRALAARRLMPYVSDARVAAALKEVVVREKESDDVQIRAAQALAAGGYTGDVELYAKLASSENPIIRQVIAGNLGFVKDERVIPILEKLLHDGVQVVRRDAIDSLVKKRAPRVMEELNYLAEDSFGPIKGDLAQAVGTYRRKDLVPYLVWCLTDFDPIVVEKALGELFRMTGLHHGFTAGQFDRYKRSGMFERQKLVNEFVNDEERKRKAVEAWAGSHPPTYTDQDRVPHLIRQLGHTDRENVRRAIRELARITGRKTGLPPLVLKPGADVQKEADQFEDWYRNKRQAVIEDWTTWHAAK